MFPGKRGGEALKAVLVEVTNGNHLSCTKSLASLSHIGVEDGITGLPIAPAGWTVEVMVALDCPNAERRSGRRSNMGVFQLH